MSDIRGSIGVTVEEGPSAPSLPMLLGTPTAPSTTRPSPAPEVGSSLIRLSGACLTLWLVGLRMLFSPFSAICNYRGFTPCCLANSRVHLSRSH